VRPDLELIPIHGNVDTRLQRLDSGQADALILAAAGLDRLGFAARASVRMDADVMPPAPGQGALAVQVRRGDEEIAGQLSALDDPAVREEVIAERALLKAMRGGCRAPVGALAHHDGGDLVLMAGAVTSDGRTRHVLHRTIRDGDVTRGVLAAADELNRHVSLGSRIVLDTRPDLDRDFADAADRLGFRHVHVPAIAIAAAPSTELDEARRNLASYDWVVVTSRRGVEALGESLPDGPRYAAVGETTAQSLKARGITAACVPPDANADALPDAMAEVADLHGARVLLARADAATPSLPERLRAMGANVDDVVAYRTAAAPEASRAAMIEALRDQDLEAVVFASGSAVTGLVELGGTDAGRLASVKIITIGPKTSATVREAGFEVTREAASRDSAGLAAALKSALDEEVERWVESQQRLPV